MKQIKSFEYDMRTDTLESVTKKVNDFIRELTKQKASEIDVNITSTGMGLVYTVIWWDEG